MYEAVSVQVRERAGECVGDFEAAVGGQGGVVRKLHHVVEASVCAANVKDGDQVRMGARDRFVTADAVELALERAALPN